MTREEFRLSIQNDSLQYKKGRIDPTMACFGNAMSELNRAIHTIEGQYKNCDEELFSAIQALEQAYANLRSAYKNAKRDHVTLSDIVWHMRPDYVSVNNNLGFTPGDAQVESFDIQADTDGVHMYVRIKQD